jgi:SAM-dependent methyltransferase
VGDAAQTWHYGLVARWWAEFNVDGPEIAFFRPYVEADQPVLDAACGTGRLLVPYLHAGIDIDGSDISEDMLGFARDRALREGLAAPDLYAQAMHELDLPRRYRTILVCGGFGLGGVREHDVAGLRRIYEHLEPGGTFLLDNEVPYADAALWSRWPHEGRTPLPRPWRDTGERRIAADGTELELRARVTAFDPLAQHLTYEMRAATLRDGERLVEEQHELRMTLYFTHEIELMLAAAGFVDVETKAGYEDRAPTADDDFVVFVAKKPG